MLIPLNEIIVVYEQILKQLNIGQISVAIFTGTDIESLCSLKILSRFFKSLSILFNIYAVNNYTELEDKIESSRQCKTVKLFMFINCGGYIDLTAKWFLNGEEGKNAKVFLFDSIKPLHHKNIQCPDLFVLDDQHSDMENRVTTQEINRYEEMNELDLDDDIEQQQIGQLDQESNDMSPRRPAQTHLRRQLRNHRALLQKKFQSYYSKSYFSLPTSFCLYRLVRQITKQNNFALWLAIIGVTSMYLEQNITKQVMETLTNYLKNDMVRFNPQNNDKRQRGQIFRTKGYQFPVLNHWTLYESMMNSPYLMIKLSLWKEAGVIKLHEILTKIGISLDQSKQNYKYMLKQQRDKLEERIFTIAQEYDLVEITYQSFMRQIDSSSAYMASDFYYILSSILETPKPSTQTKELPQFRINQFWNAYEMLTGSQEMIKKAIENFKMRSNLFMKEAKDLIERDSIINLGKISFSNIRCDTKQKKIFQNHWTLIRLAKMLMGIQRQRKMQNNKSYVRNIPAIPFVASLTLTDTERPVCMIVGVVPQSKNNIGNCFNTVATNLKLQVQHDRFMSNVIIIPKDSLLQFTKEVGKNFGRE